MIHFNGDKVLGPAYAITETQAGDIAARAERALAAELSDGYPRPLSDGALGGDGRIDIYVEDYTAFPGVLGSAGWDTNTPTSSALSSVICKPDWRIACSAAPIAYWMKRSILRTSFFSIQSSGSKSVTSPATLVG